MTEIGNGVWTVSVTCGHEEFPLSYRYVINTKDAAGAERKVSEAYDRRMPLESLVRAPTPRAAERPPAVEAPPATLRGASVPQALQHSSA